MRKTRNIILIALMTGLTCIGGFVRIPFFPVPLTLQTLFVYLSGSILGPWPGCISQGLYLCIGLAGLPVFSSGGGPAYILHPTFGYLMAFPLASWVVGKLLRGVGIERKQFTRILIRLTAGMGIILGTGIIGLIIHTHWLLQKPVDIIHLVWAGGLLFIPGEIVKILMTGHLILKFRPLIERGEI